MPEGLQIADRHQDPYAWALTQAEQLRRGAPVIEGVDRRGLTEFLEEWAEDMLSAARSHIVNLLTHAAKAALTHNPDIVGHWRSECVEFHDRLIDAHRPSMRGRIDTEALWRRARRKVIASFDDHGEPRPALPAKCPFTLDRLVKSHLDIDELVEAVRRKGA